MLKLWERRLCVRADFVFWLVAMGGGGWTKNRLHLYDLAVLSSKKCLALLWMFVYTKWKNFHSAAETKYPFSFNQLIICLKMCIWIDASMDPDCWLQNSFLLFKNYKYMNQTKQLCNQPSKFNSICFVFLSGLDSFLCLQLVLWFLVCLYQTDDLICEVLTFDSVISRLRLS